MPFDPSQPFTLTKAGDGFDPSKPFTLTKAPPPKATADDHLQADMISGASQDYFANPTPAPKGPEVPVELTQEHLEAMADAEAPMREPSLRERFRNSEVARRLLGPTDVEREAMVGSQGSPGEILGSLLKFTTPPPQIAGPIRTVTDPAIAVIPNATARGITTGVREMALGFPLAAPANTAALIAFAADAVWHLPEQKEAFDAARREGDTEQAAAIATQALGTGLLLAAGMGGKAAAETVGARRAMLGEPAKAPPSPDLVARNLAAPGTRRPQEFEAFNPPEASRPSEMVQTQRVPIFNRNGEVVDIQVQPRIREIVFDEPGVIEQPAKRAIKTDVEGGKLSFAAEAPALLRNAPEPRKPGVISDTAIEGWADRAIAEGRERLNIGLDPELLAAYAVKGAAHIERGVRKFSDWSLKMIAEHGDAIRPHLRRIFEESTASLSRVGAATQELKVRKLAARAAESPETPPDIQAQIRNDPSTLYQPQAMDRVADRIGKMTNDELASTPFVQPDGTENIWVASQLERYKRARASGQPEQAMTLLREAWERGTALGQLVNQFKMLRGATPEGVIDMVNQRLTDRKLPEMSTVDRIGVRVLTDNSIKINETWKAAERVYQESPTPENFDTVYDTRRQAIEADRHLQEKIRAINPASFWDLLTTIQQGNKITAVSQGRNILGNFSSLWLRAPARGVAAMVDAVDSYVRNKPREITVAPTKTIPAALGAAKRSAPEVGNILRNGATDFELSKADAHVGLRPMVALRDLIAGNMRNKPGLETLVKAVEASPFSWIPAASLRMLAAADLPAREAARGRLVAEAMTLREKNARRQITKLQSKKDKNLQDLAAIIQLKSERATPDRIIQATKIPELFFTPEELARMQNEAAGAVFQQSNRLVSSVIGGIQSLPGPARFLIRLGLPFVRTPANIIREVFRFTPFGFINAWRLTQQGKSRAAKMAIGEAIVGSMFLMAGNLLYSKGLIGPPLSADDEQQKARMLSGEVLPSGHINITGLKRYLETGEGGWQAGDTTMDVATMGIGGALLWNVATARRQMEKQPVPDGGLDIASQLLIDLPLSTVGYAVNQSFLKGTSDALEAIAGQQFDQFWRGYAGSLLDVGTPRQLESMSRAMREGAPTIKGDTGLETLENVLRSRLGAFGADDKLAMRRDLWGRPMRETPEGRTPWVYQNLDMTKARSMPDDPVNQTLYSLWRHTANPRVIPTPPDKTLSVMNQQFNLTAEQHSRLQELVGTARRRVAEKVIPTEGFLSSNREAQIAILDRLWSTGARIGTLRFIYERHGQLQAKEVPAGLK